MEKDLAIRYIERVLGKDIYSDQGKIGSCADVSDKDLEEFIKLQRVNLALTVRYILYPVRGARLSDALLYYEKIREILGRVVS